MILDRTLRVPQPHRIDQHELADPFGKSGGILRGNHSAEAMPDEIKAIELKRSEEVVVVKNEIPEIVELRQVCIVHTSRMSGRVDLSLGGQIVEEAKPFL